MARLFYAYPCLFRAMIMYMQQLMFFSFEQALVQILYRHVLLRSLDIAQAIRLIEAVRPALAGPAECIGLSTAAYAAIGARHDLYKMILLFPGLYLLNQLIRIFQAIDNGDVYLHAVIIHRTFLYTLEPTHTGKGNLMQFCCGLVYHEIAKYRFCYPTRYAKNNACAAVDMEMPNGRSTASGNSSVKAMLASRIILMSSCVVMT